MDVGTRIKNLREESGLTQLAFAKILNINNSTLCQYESGDRIPSDDIKGRIADYFCVSMDYLMGRTNIREKLPSAVDEELSDARKKALQFIDGLSDDQLDRFINMGRAALEMGGGQQTQNTPRGEARG